MILDRLENADRYAGMHASFAKAFAFLRQPSLAAMADGKHVIDGERLMVIMGKEPGKGERGTKLESHRKYIDIQYTLSGIERIGWKPAKECRVSTPHDDARDVAFYGDASESWVTVQAGTFVVFYPEDAHAPLAGDGTPHKAVVKVAVDW